MNALEPPLDRLNYFNGQRLEEVDLRVEQEYHIRVRRWLNKTLYAPGIASGLEVAVKTGDLHRVVVSPGLAIDHEGREIILLEPREVVVVGIPSTRVGVVYGNYLVIAYAEAKTAPVDGRCAMQVSGKATRRDLAWGAPSRIRAEPVIQFQDVWAGEPTGQIVLAQIELDNDCAVREIHTSIRKYVAAAKPPVVRPISLEGEKDIDADNPKVLRFHVEGSYPDSAALYLRATLFSTLYYTEMGKHTHALTINLDPIVIKEHSHTLNDLETDSVDAPSYTVEANVGNTEKNRLETKDGGDHPGFSVLNTLIAMTLTPDQLDHSHMIAGGQSTATALEYEISLQDKLTDRTVGDFGAPEMAARLGPDQVGAPARTYVKDLIITFDDTQDITTQVLAQLEGRAPGFWGSLGDGTAGHHLVTEGTGSIDLVGLGLDLSPGAHSLTFSVPTGGGQIQYNLYVG